MKYQITKNELTSTLKNLPNISNHWLKRYYDYKFFDAGESQNNSLTQFMKDFSRNFLCQGEYHLGLNNIEKSTNQEIIQQIKLLLKLSNDDEAYHIINAHSQGPGGFLPFVLAMSCTSRTDRIDLAEFIIKQPSLSDHDNNLYKNSKNEILVECHYDRFPVISPKTDKLCGYIDGPALVTFKLNQNEQKKWGFELVNIQTDSKFIYDVVCGKNFNDNEIQNAISPVNSVSQHAKKLEKIVNAETKFLDSTIKKNLQSLLIIYQKQLKELGTGLPTNEDNEHNRLENKIATTRMAFDNPRNILTLSNPSDSQTKLIIDNIKNDLDKLQLIHDLEGINYLSNHTKVGKLTVISALNHISDECDRFQTYLENSIKTKLIKLQTLYEKENAPQNKALTRILNSNPSNTTLATYCLNNTEIIGLNDVSNPNPAQTIEAINRNLIKFDVLIEIVNSSLRNNQLSDVDKIHEFSKLLEKNKDIISAPNLEIQQFLKETGRWIAAILTVGVYAEKHASKINISNKLDFFKSRAKTFIQKTEKETKPVLKK